jgi:hypothetical protein
MLGNYWPGPRDLFCSLASPIALAFLTAYPTPHSAARLGEARMAAFLRRHSYRGGKSPALLLARLHRFGCVIACIVMICRMRSGSGWRGSGTPRC